MLNTIRDIKTAVRLTTEVRKARKDGADAVHIEPVRILPVAAVGVAPLDTMEGCSAWNMGQEIYQAWAAVFRSFPRETQRRLAFTPEKPGEWVERTRFWRRELKPVLPPRTYHLVMLQFIGWYIHCLRMRGGGKHHG